MVMVVVVVMAARAAASRREGVLAAWPALGSASFKHRRGDQRSAAPSRKSSCGGRSTSSTPSAPSCIMPHTMLHPAEHGQRGPSSCADLAHTEVSVWA